MHFRILQVIATMCFLRALELFTEFVFGWVSAPAPLGEQTVLPLIP